MASMQPSSSSETPSQSKYPLEDTSSSTISLPDGRKLGYAEYGLRTGRPIIYFPGWPSSRLEGAFLHQTASKAGARIITVERPGFGMSSPHENRTLLSHAQDVEMLTDHLKLQRYGVLGISGGGPYALAAARTFPAERLRVATVVCGLGSPDMGYQGMNWFHWAGWSGGGRMFPGLVRWWFSREPEGRLDLSEEERLQRVRRAFERAKAKMPPKDVEFFGDVEYMRMRLRVAAEVYKQGMYAMSEDMALPSSDFGFKIEDIRKDLPFHVWHGRFDNFVPTQHGEKVAARLGEHAQLHLSDDTHASVFAAQKEAFLAEMVRAI